MTSIRVGLVSLLLCFALVITAEAEEDSAFDRVGPYVALGGGLGFPVNLEDDLEKAVQRVLGPASSVHVDQGIALVARLGYRIHSNLAFEAQYEWLSNLEATARFQGASTSDDFNFHAVTLNAKPYFLNGRWQPFIVLGIGASHTTLDSDDDTVIAGRFGAGIDAYVTPQVALNFESSYLLPDKGKEFPVDRDYVSISLSLQYRF
jgi:opacity protein-like surface antigen